jgi:hypothetical protein
VQKSAASLVKRKDSAKRKNLVPHALLSIPRIFQHLPIFFFALTLKCVTFSFSRFCIIYNTYSRKVTVTIHWHYTKAAVELADFDVTRLFYSIFNSIVNVLVIFCCKVVFMFYATILRNFETESKFCWPLWPVSNDVRNYSAIENRRQ